MNKPNFILRRPGGKTRLLKYLLPLPPHKCYVEVFAGGAALLRAKEISGLEILNDNDEVIVNAFRCVRFHAEAVVKELELQINSRADFIAYKQQPGLTDIQRAARWLYLNMLSFGGESDSFGVQKEKNWGGAASSLSNLRMRILECHKRLEGVVIEKLDWRRCLALYDSPETLFFCDPPYVGGKIKSYAAWKQEQMAEFAVAMRRLAGNWIITVNDSAENRKLFAFGKQRRITRHRGIANHTRRGSQTYGELIIRKINE